MSNHSDQYIEILIAFILFYSRIFGICNYNYDFKKNKLTYPRALVIYVVIANIILILLLPFSLYTQFGTNFNQLQEKDLTFKVRKAVAIVNAVTVCVGLIGQWTAPEKTRILFGQFGGLREKECSTLKRLPIVAKKTVILFLLKSIISAVFVIGCFGTMFLETQNRSLEHTIISIYFAILENIILCVKNQFYYALVFVNYQFELLNDHIVSVTEKILSLKTQRYRRGAMEIIVVTRGFHLGRELEVIGKIHTDLFDVSHTIRDMYQFPILIALLTVIVTQVSLCFTIILYLLKNQIQIIPMEFFYVEGSKLVLSVVNVGLLIYVCGSVVYQCNLGGEHIKILNWKRHLGMRLEKKIEMLSFQFKREKMHLSLCGMIDMDWTTGFNMASACLFYLVLLLQLDYKNL